MVERRVVAGGVGGAGGGRAHLEELLEGDGAVDHGC